MNNAKLSRDFMLCCNFLFLSFLKKMEFLLIEGIKSFQAGYDDLKLETEINELYKDKEKTVPEECITPKGKEGKGKIEIEGKRKIEKEGKGTIEIEGKGKVEKETDEKEESPSSTEEDSMFNDVCFWKINEIFIHLNYHILPNDNF